MILFNINRCTGIHYPFVHIFFFFLLALRIAAMFYDISIHVSAFFLSLPPLTLYIPPPFSRSLSLDISLRLSLFLSHFIYSSVFLSFSLTLSLFSSLSLSPLSSNLSLSLSLSLSLRLSLSYLNLQC